MEFLAEYGLIGLFAGSFLAATVVPFSADVLLIGMLAAGANPVAAIIIATAGNWLGGITSYAIGRAGKWEWIEKLRVSRESLERQQRRIERFGAPIALLTWVPFIGDVFAVALGFYRVKAVPAMIWMLIGKAARFICWYLIYYIVV
jgi:membrane protein YqaA with SNARE-associated domain